MVINPSGVGMNGLNKSGMDEGERVDRTHGVKHFECWSFIWFEKSPVRATNRNHRCTSACT